MTRKVNIMTNVVKGDQVKDSYGKIYDVIEVHEHNVMVLEPGKPYWERICMGRFDFDSYFRRADEPMTDDMPRPMGVDEEDFDEDEEEEEKELLRLAFVSRIFIAQKRHGDILSVAFFFGRNSPFMLFLLRSFLCRADNTCPFWQ